MGVAAPGAATAPVALRPQRASEGLSARMWRRFVRNRLALISLWLLVAITLAVAVWPLFLGSPEAIDTPNALKDPTPQHLLGTDELGRDTLTRLLHAGRISLVVGFMAMAISILVGSLVGGIAGYFGGTADTVLMRITDAMMSLPAIFLLLVILVVFGSGLVTVVVVIGVTSWMGAARVVRAEVLRFKNAEFVEAARAMGARPRRILAVHVFPNAVPSIIVTASLGVARAILTESALSYLGLGIQAPTPSLGNMLSNAQTYLWNAPLQALWPGLLILLIVLASNFLGDGLRDALDPQMA